jgi:FMN reductase
MGATIRTYHGLFSPDGECLEDRARLQLEMVGSQTFRGARALASL